MYIVIAIILYAGWLYLYSKQEGKVDVAAAAIGFISLMFWPIGVWFCLIYLDETILWKKK